MLSVQENVANLSAVLAEVHAHPMCARFTESADKYLVIFPPGYQLDGVQVSKGLGKTKALQIALEKMEKYWKLW